MAAASVARASRSRSSSASRQARLGELERLVGGAEPERGLGAEARLGHHLVVATGAAGVVREADVVVAAFGAHGVERGLVEAPALPPEQAASGSPRGRGRGGS